MQIREKESSIYFHPSPKLRNLIQALQVGMTLHNKIRFCPHAQEWDVKNPKVWIKDC